ncbi:TauD/TfdA-like taurine catabolism dioxygenase [Aureococcus anophagefferens]|nr:TauD/TfdA-like taurine catabolism dioxygenase [Aureococcus anophagefferens]
MKLIAYSTIASTACAFVSTSPAAPAVSLRAVEARAVEAAPARDLTGRIPDCPATLWDDQNIDYFRERSGAILGDLEKHGCVWFRGFDLMKTEAGFRQFYEAVGLDPRLDPIHTPGLALAPQSDALYEEPATVSGGEFFIADAKIARDLDADVAQRIYDKKIRISVSNLDLNFLEAAGPFKEGLMEGAKNAVDTLVAPKFDMDLEMIYGADGKPMRLQAVEQVASPLNRHPKTGELLWFCNIHNHATSGTGACTVPEVGMTEVYHGDLSAISSDDLDHINADRPADYDDGDDDAQKPGDLLNAINARRRRV